MTTKKTPPPVPAPVELPAVPPTRTFWARHRYASIAIIAAAVLVVVAGTASVTAAVFDTKEVSAPIAPSASAPVVNTVGFPQGGVNPGIFTDTCARTLTAPNDPIMLPGETGASMQHDFFGNPSVTATSTPKGLVGGRTTCSTSADASAYWTPVVYQNGKALAPSRTLIYWRAPAATASSVKTMPAGISIIGGNELATSAQDKRVVNWTCQVKGGGLTKASDAPHDCPGSVLRLVITFPNCWDGKTLDAMPKEGMAPTNVVYATRAGCPSDHPVQIPQIVFHVNYPTSSGEGITLSTGPDSQGPPITGHADFMNGWNQKTMDADAAACITAQVRCGPVTGPDATPQGGKVRAS